MVVEDGEDGVVVEEGEDMVVEDGVVGAENVAPFKKNLFQMMAWSLVPKEVLSHGGMVDGEDMLVEEAGEDMVGVEVDGEDGDVSVVLLMTLDMMS